MAWRFNFRRSRSDSPPQIPKRSSLANAYSKHSARTVQLEHTRFASRVDPPFSGKNASGSVCAHNACWCQANSSSAFTPNVQMSSILPPLWPKLHTCGSFASSPSGESACTKTGRTKPHHPPNRSPPAGDGIPRRNHLLRSHRRTATDRHGRNVLRLDGPSPPREPRPSTAD